MAARALLPALCVDSARGGVAFAFLFEPISQPCPPVAGNDVGGAYQVSNFGCCFPGNGSTGPLGAAFR